MYGYCWAVVLLYRFFLYAMSLSLTHSLSCLFCSLHLLIPPFPSSFPLYRLGLWRGHLHRAGDEDPDEQPQRAVEDEQDRGEPQQGHHHHLLRADRAGQHLSSQYLVHGLPDQRRPALCVSPRHRHRECAAALARAVVSCECMCCLL